MSSISKPLGKAATLALVIALGAAFGACGADYCVMGAHEPEEIEADLCAEHIPVEVSARVTCSSVLQGWVNGSTNVPHIPGEYVPSSVNVALSSYDCGHDGCHPITNKTVSVRIVYKGCDTCPAGTEEGEIGSLRHRINLGRAADGGAAGFLELYASDAPDASFATPEALKLFSLRGVDAVRDRDTGHLRQILAAECFVTVDPVDEHRYTVSFHTPGSVESELDTNGWYVLKSGASPFSHFLIENPDTTNAFRRMRISRTANGEARATEYAWERDNQDRLNWSLGKGGGLQEIGLCVEPYGDGESKTWTTRAQGGAAAAVERKQYMTFGGSRLLTLAVRDPAGAALTTRYEYTESGALRLTVGPGGSWNENVFSGGWVSERRSGWLDASTNASEEATQVTAYIHIPFLAVVETNIVDMIVSTNEQSVVQTNFTYNIQTNLWPDTGVTDPGTPRVETVIAAGVPIAKILRVIYTDTMGYKRVEEVRLADPAAADHAAAYADPANPRTVRTYLPKNDALPGSERPETVRYPDGRTEAWDYVTGTYEAGADGSPGVFTRNPAGSCVRTTLTRATADAPGGIAFRTTRGATVETLTGRVLQTETLLYVGGGYDLISWNKNTLNDLGQVVTSTGSDRTRTDTTWNCCGPESQTAADGSVTETAYDALKRPVLTTRTGEGSQPDIFTETAYDAAGRTTFSRTSSGGLSQSTTNTYDLAGRLTWSRGPDGIETTYLYDTNANTTIRGGLTNRSVRFADGRAHYTEQNGVRQQTHAYGVNPDGSQWNTVFTGPDGADSPAWSKTITDPLGRTVAQVRPGYGGALLVTSNAYDLAGRLLSQTVADATNPENHVILSRNLNQYDSLGEPLLTAQDLDLDGEIDLAGPDRVSGQATRYVQLSGDWWQETASWTYTESGSAAPLTNAIARTRLTGLGDAYSADGASGILTAESVSVDARGNQTISRTVTDRGNKTVYQITDTPDSSVAALTVTVNGLAQSSRSTHNLTTTYAYDALGRQTASQDARGAVRSRGYDALGRVAWESDPAQNGTWYAYDSLGRRTAVTNALGQVTHTAYDAEGRTVATWGATYPLAYEYDPSGRMTAMRTFRDEESPGDETQWLYDEATGLLTNKVYADGMGTAYTYTPDGKLATRDWARGVTTTYSYANCCSSLTQINYSDDTPDVTFTHDRLGRMTSAIVAGISTNAYTYDPETLALSVETQNGMEINRTTDVLGRDTGFSFDGIDYGVSYAYDSVGRFSQVSNFQFQVSYSYLPNTDLLSGMTTSSGFLWTRAYESGRSLITSVENRFGETVISRYDYDNDALGRRTSRADSGSAFANPAFDAYSYNGRSEVTGAQRYHGTDVSDTSTVYGGREFGYEYDPIGNRTSASETIGGETLSKTYTANALNQYTAIANPAAVGLRGDATNTAVVTVNGLVVQSDDIASDSIPWHFSLEADNAVGPDFSFAEIVAVVNPPGTNTPDIVASSSGHIYAPPQNETLTFDLDGNLLSDGRWQYTWNGENRLIKAEEQVSPTNRQPYTVEYAYDHQGRMVWKQISTNAVMISSRTLLWDGYNIVQEKIANQQSTITNAYVWVLDYSGILQKTGGVGGLLAEVQNGVHNFAAFDANGNVTEYLSTDGTLAAHYEYSPFGEIVVQSGDLAESFTHRFSTKPWCPVTGLSEYEKRKYRPGLGRWLNRDPIKELGNRNLFIFLANRTLENNDFLGLCCSQKDIDEQADTFSTSATRSTKETFIKLPIKQYDPYAGTITKIINIHYEFGGYICCTKNALHTAQYQRKAKLPGLKRMVMGIGHRICMRMIIENVRLEIKSLQFITLTQKSLDSARMIC
jgi:RHS repeat-associated protein